MHSPAGWYSYMYIFILHALHDSPFVCRCSIFPYMSHSSSLLLSNLGYIHLSLSLSLSHPYSLLPATLCLTLAAVCGGLNFYKPQRYIAPFAHVLCISIICIILYCVLAIYVYTVDAHLHGV